MIRIMLAVVVFAASLHAADFAWIEGENPTRKPAIAGVEVSGWGHAEYMSEGKVLKVSVGEADVEKVLGKDGATFEYDFELAKDGRYEAWSRIGFEWVRSDFDWKIDG